MYRVAHYVKTSSLIQICWQKIRIDYFQVYLSIFGQKMKLWHTVTKRIDLHIMLMMPRKITELLRGYFKSLANFATLNKLHGLESFLCNINVVNRFWFFFTLFVCFKLHLAAVLLLTVQVFVAIFKIPWYDNKSSI